LSASSVSARCRLVASRLDNDSRKRTSSSLKCLGSLEGTDGGATGEQRHREPAGQAGVEVGPGHDEAPFAAVVGDDHRPALREQEARGGVGAVGHAIAELFAFDQSHAAMDAELEPVRLEQQHDRQLDLQGLGRDHRHLLQQHLRIAGVDGEPAEQGQMLAETRALQRLLHARIGADVADRRHHQRQAMVLQRTERDLDHHLGAVATPGHELHLRSHRPRHGLSPVGLAKRCVTRANAVRHQCVHRHADQLFDRIAEQERRRGICQHDDACGIGDDQCVGIGDEQGAKDAVFVEVRSEVRERGGRRGHGMRRFSPS